MEYETEPVRGLPERLPAGEQIIWQGAPDWRRLARDALKTRWIAAYFAALLIWALADGSNTGVVMTLVVATGGLGLLYGLAFLSARTTVYTITTRRVVMRFGIALPKCINLPMTAIGSADLKRNSDGTGDIPLALCQPHRLGYAQFWPHVRPWKVGEPQPMLRSIADVEAVAGLLGEALHAALPAGRTTLVERGPAEPRRALAAA